MSISISGSMIVSGITITPVSIPGVPTIGTATATGTTTATVTFTAPYDSGGSPITSYTAVSSPDGITATSYQADSGTIFVSGLTAGSTYTFTVYATNGLGNSSASSASNSITMSAPVGQAEFTTPGSYTWVAPTGVTNISVLVVGPGGSSVSYSVGGGGGGGGLVYANVAVVPGTSYAVVVGDPATRSTSYFNTSTYMYATAGGNGAAGGGWICGGGGGAAGYQGNGGIGGSYPTGGAAGGAGGTGGASFASHWYVGGNGGVGSTSTLSMTTVNAGGNGSGGGGGGGAGDGGSQYAAARPGGGVGIYGQGANGTGGPQTAAGMMGTMAATGGSGGSNLGVYGGGGAGGGQGGSGAVRIIWPSGSRYYPSTGTANYALPGAPTIGTATIINGSRAAITFTAPVDTGNATITSYTAVSSPSNIIGTLSQSGSGTIYVDNLAPNTTYTFTVYATNAVGSGPSSAASNSVNSYLYTNQQAYTTPGTYTWVCPVGVTSVSVVAVGGAGGYFNDASTSTTKNGADGSGGGGLGWKNNIPVVPGQSYTVVVGNYGTFSQNASVRAGNGGDSYFIDTSTVKGGGGQGAWVATTNSAGGTYVGDGGGNGGKGGRSQPLSYSVGGGGGGAGGYSGDGGEGGGFTGTSSSGQNGSGGGGGGGATAATGSKSYGGAGGGVGILGEGASGLGAGYTGSNNQPGGAGSGGTNSLYGGGGGGNNTNGGAGAVRIIWPGDRRLFPSTRTTDETN